MMKGKFSILLLLLLVAAGARAESDSLPAPWQAADSMRIATVSRDSLRLDSLALIPTVDSDLVAIRRAADGEGMILEVAGFGITLGQAASENGKRPRSRVSGLVFDGIELGFNALTGLDYADYPAGSDDFMEIRPGNSFHFSTTIFGLAVDLGRKRMFQLSTGLRYTVDNYRLSDPSITLGREAGRIVPVTLDEKADKSKLRITSLGFPLQLRVEPIRHLRIALTGYFDFSLGSNAIHKRPKVREPLSGVNVFRFGLGAAVSYRSVGLYVRYGLTPLFESGEGPVCRPISFGVSVFM